MNASENKLEKP